MSTNTLAWVFAFILSTMFQLVRAQSSDIIAPGAHLQKLAGGFAFTEGPACDSRGNVFFTDQPNDRILEWSVNNRLSTFLHPCGHANGLCFDSHGNLWACADGSNELWCIYPSGKHTAAVTGYGGKRLNGPNDVWIRPDGGLYLTDPFYKRDYWTRGPMEQNIQGVYYLAPGSHALACVASDFRVPNGIIGSPDGKILYVSDLGAGKTFVYNIAHDGSLSNKRLFCTLGSDGMTIDSGGNLYLTGQGVTVFDSTGKQIAHVTVPEDWTGNVCFGGTDRHTLFITASKGLYALALRFKGVGSQ